MFSLVFLKKWWSGRFFFSSFIYSNFQNTTLTDFYINKWTAVWTTHILAGIIYSKSTMETPENINSIVPVCFCYFFTDFIYCSTVPIVEYEQVNASWNNSIFSVIYWILHWTCSNSTMKISIFLPGVLF